MLRVLAWSIVAIWGERWNYNRTLGLRPVTEYSGGYIPTQRPNISLVMDAKSSLATDGLTYSRIIAAEQGARGAGNIMASLAESNSGGLRLLMGAVLHIHILLLEKALLI